MTTPAPLAPRSLLVCAGLIVGDDLDRLLVTRRRDDDHLGGLWEFPGGKVEPREDPRLALGREIAEEIAVAVSVGRVVEVLFDESPGYVVTILCFLCRTEATCEPRAIEVAEWRWVPIAALDSLCFVPADTPFVSQLAQAARAGRSPLAPFVAPL
jgi:8-oxo-dGTP diphosphatase